MTLKKILLSLLGTFVLFVLLAILALPLFFSSTAGKKILLQAIEGRSGLKLEIDSLSLSWFSTQTVKGIKGKEDQFSFTCEEIASDAPLWKILIKNDFGHAHVRAPDLQVSKPFQPLSQLKERKIQSAGFVASLSPQLGMPTFGLPFQGHLDVTEGSAEFNPPGLDPIVFNQITLSCDITPNDQIAFSLTGVAKQQVEGQIAVKGSISQFSNAIPNVSLESTLSHLPVRGIDQLISLFFPDLNGVIYNALGETIDLQCRVNTVAGNFDLNLNAQSPQMTAQIATQSLNGNWSLKAPAQITFHLTPSLFQKVANSSLILTQIAALQITIPEFTCPQLDFNKAAFQATVSAPQPLLFSLSGSPLALNPFSLNAESSSMGDLIHISGKTVVNQMGSFAFDGSILPLLRDGKLSIVGEKLPADLFGAFIATDTPFSTLVGQSVDLNATLEWGTPKLHFSWHSALLNISSFDLTNGTFSSGKITYSGAFPLTMDQVQGSFLTRDSFIKGQLNCAQVNLNQQIILKNLAIPFEWNGKNGMVQLSSQVQNPTSELGSMKGVVNVSGDSMSAASISGSLDLENIPSAMLDMWTKQSIFSSVMGPSFTSKIKWQSTPDQQNLAIDWTSLYLNSHAAFLIDSAGLQLQGSNNTLSWTLTPDSYTLLDSVLTGPTKNLVPFSLKEASTFNLSLTKVFIPTSSKKQVTSLADRFPDLVYDLAALQLSATGNTSNLTFFDKTSQEVIQFSGLNFSVSKNTTQNPLNITVDSTVQTLGTSAKSGTLSLAAKLEPLSELSKLTGNFQLTAKQIPSRALDVFARASGRTDLPFTTLFGDRIDATIALQLKEFSGPVSLNLNTPLTRASIVGTLASGALVLSEPIYTQMKITPEMSRLALKEVNPLNLSSIYSQDPITIEIPAEGFYLPIYPYDTSKIAIPSATIELGKISCRNEGNINIALSLLKTKQFDKNGDLALWFAPIDFSIQKGLINIERTEILLANTFDICLWGNVDLLKDQVDMVLGLTAQTLNKAFGIKNLPENYVLTIPMRGKADNVQINSGKATAKIALLLAWQQKDIAGAIGGGPAGAIVGGLLGKLATLPDSNAKVPPAKHPFPWEVGRNNRKETSEAKPEKRRHFKQKENPLKQIMKVIR